MSVEKCERLIRDLDGQYEVWSAMVDGRRVETTVRYAEFKPHLGRIPFRDFVIQQLEAAA